MACIEIEDWKIVFGELDHKISDSDKLITDIVYVNDKSKDRGILQMEKLDKKEMINLIKRLGVKKIHTIDTHKVYTKEEILDIIMK